MIKVIHTLSRLYMYNVSNFCALQKSATAVAYCKRGRGNLRVNGRPLELVEPRVLQYKLQEPILLLGKVSDRNRNK